MGSFSRTRRYSPRQSPGPGAAHARGCGSGPRARLLGGAGPGRAGRVSPLPAAPREGSPVACHPQPASWSFLPRQANGSEALGSRSPTPNSAKFPASLPGWPRRPSSLLTSVSNRFCRDVCAIEPSPQMPTPADSPLIHPTSWVGPKVCWYFSHNFMEKSE